ncbi:MAG: primosomal protein N' [Bacteroidaceae bacterium]
MPRYADVVLPLPFGETLTYSLPDTLQAVVLVGSRVIVPLGSRKFYSAIVTCLHDNKPAYATKEVVELADDRPLVLPSQLRLWRWIADYYLCTLGDVYKAALPAGLKLESESSVMFADDFTDLDILTPSERRIYDLLEQDSVQKLSALQKQTGISSILTLVNHMLEKGAVKVKEEVKRTYKPRTIPCVRITLEYFEESVLRNFFLSLPRKSKQQELLMRYMQLSSTAAAQVMQNYSLLKDVTREELLQDGTFSPSSFNTLRKKGVLEIWQKPVGRLSEEQIPAHLVMHALSEAQQQAMNQIEAVWEQRDICLLHGVTSSGKTEVYIHLIQKELERGKQILFMLPEIVLTTQLTERLKRVFGDLLGVYHSRYPDAERVEVYQKMLSEKPYDIIVGVRSSVFLPFRRLGLVIVDEEHETSFKQQDPAPRYHARNVALVLAAQHKAKTLLGTATPSLETYHNALIGKYGLVTLDKRFRDVRLPDIRVVNVQELRRKRLMTGPFSPHLVDLMREALLHRKQVILFQNRRGYSRMVECHVCGWTPKCEKCDVSLTYHQRIRQMVCHYCGTTYPVPTQCPCCESKEIHNVGYGTERIEDQLEKVLPEARIARMDLDTTRRRMAYEQILQDFQQGKTDILVGTQMVTKGLDFEHVSVVGILDADGMLSQPDFRSHERAFQMMEQVAGRAGRKGSLGHVVLQTRDPNSPVVQQVMQHDYQAMYKAQMEERRLFGYPPFCRLVSVYMKHRDEHLADLLSRDMAQMLQTAFHERVLGPDTPPIGRVQMMHIRKVLIKIEPTASLGKVREYLRQVQKFLLAQPRYKGGLIYYDVD